MRSGGKAGCQRFIAMTPEYRHALGIALWVFAGAFLVVDGILDRRLHRYLRAKYPHIASTPWLWRWSVGDKERVKSDPRWRHHQRWIWLIGALGAGAAAAAGQLTGFHLFFV